MNTYSLQDWTQLIARIAQYRAMHGYVRLSAKEAKALIACDAELHGYEEFRCDGTLAYVQVDASLRLDHFDLTQAIRIGIDRSAEVSGDDPLLAKKRAAFRETQTALFGPLDQPIDLSVGAVRIDIWPKAAKQS